MGSPFFDLIFENPSLHVFFVTGFTKLLRENIHGSIDFISLTVTNSVCLVAFLLIALGVVAIVISWQSGVPPSINPLNISNGLRSSISCKTAGIKPVESTSKPSGEIVQKTFKPKSEEEIQKDKDYIDKRNKTNRKNARRMKRAKFWGNISSALTPSGKSGFKGGCL